MQLHPNREDYRELRDAKLTELELYAKDLCPEAKIEISTVRYEDGSVYIFPPPSLSEEEEERIERAVAARARDIFEGTGLFILCAALDPTAR
jgi:hypothetical protein